MLPSKDSTTATGNAQEEMGGREALSGLKLLTDSLHSMS